MASIAASTPMATWRRPVASSTRIASSSVGVAPGLSTQTCDLVGGEQPIEHRELVDVAGEEARTIGGADAQRRVATSRIDRPTHLVIRYAGGRLIARAGAV